MTANTLVKELTDGQAGMWEHRRTHWIDSWQKEAFYDGLTRLTIKAPDGRILHDKPIKRKGR